MQNPTTPQPVAVEASTLPATRPITQAEISVIRQQRSEMSSQIQAAQRRRDNLLESIRTAPPGTEEGLKQQLQVLSDRIVSTERDIEASGRLLRTGQVPVGTVIVPPRDAFGGISPQAAAIRGATLTTSIIVPILVAIVFLRWIRGKRRGDGRNPAEHDARMERLEQAVDAIALEIERVGESQRFQSRVLAEANLIPATGAGQRIPQPVRMPEFEELREQ